jgi:hypothetical protein
MDVVVGIGSTTGAEGQVRDGRRAAHRRVPVILRVRVGFERYFFVWMVVVLPIGLWMTTAAFAH